MSKKSALLAVALFFIATGLMPTMGPLVDPSGNMAMGPAIDPSGVD